MQLSSDDKRRYGLVAVLLLWCGGLAAFWLCRTIDTLVLWLLWNLFLGTLPLAWSAGFRYALQRGRPMLTGLFFVLWLLFLPNAPYLVTDLIHLKARALVPLWYVLATLLSFAGTGTLLGFLSLEEVQSVVAERLGRRWSWAMAMGALMLSGFGIYLGRFLRWNSWDAFTRPAALLQSMLRQFVDPGDLPHPVPVTLVFGLGLTVGYLVFRGLARGT